jgi:hypothetical protein
MRIYLTLDEIKADLADKRDQEAARAKNVQGIIDGYRAAHATYIEDASVNPGLYQTFKNRESTVKAMGGVIFMEANVRGSRAASAAYDDALRMLNELVA